MNPQVYVDNQDPRMEDGTYPYEIVLVAVEHLSQCNKILLHDR